MSREELEQRMREHHAAMHVVCIEDDSGNTLFWYEVASREAAELECDHFEAHGIEASSSSGPRRQVALSLDERKRRHPEHARARAHRLAAKG